VDETTTTTVVRTTTSVEATGDTAGGSDTSAVDGVETIVDWSEASNYVDQKVTVTGDIVGVDDMGEDIGKIVLRIGSTETDGFNAMIRYENTTGEVTAEMLAGLVGQTIEVTGEVYFNESEARPEIEMTSPDQIRAVG